MSLPPASSATPPSFVSRGAPPPALPSAPSPLPASLALSSIDDVKDALLSSLSNHGVLDSVRAQLHSAVLQTLHGALAPPPRPPPDSLLINDLIREYLGHAGLSHALAVFNLETGHANASGSSGGPPPPVMGLSRDFIARELDISLPRRETSAEAVPLLYSLVATAKMLRAGRSNAPLSAAPASSGAAYHPSHGLHAHAPLAAAPAAPPSFSSAPPLRTSRSIQSVANDARGLEAHTGGGAARGAAASSPASTADDNPSSARGWGGASSSAPASSPTHTGGSRLFSSTLGGRAQDPIVILGGTLR